MPRPARIERKTAETDIDLSLNLDGTGGAFNLLPSNTEVVAFDTVTEREVARGSIRIPQGGIGFMFLLPRSAR